MIGILAPLMLVLALAPSAIAVTDADLSSRITIDGYSSDFAEDEAIFIDVLVDVNGDGMFEAVSQERNNDSKWGFNNDLNQIKASWDNEALYVAVDGISWDNNIVLLFDYLPGGLDKMTQLNSWRRNFVFAGDLRPDLFLATWDGNTTPQIWRFARENQVTQVDITQFETVATFAQGNTGRSMEARIPWPVFYGTELERRYDETLRDSAYVLPDGLDHARSIRLAAILTAGGDGSGGPDSAPDNLGGHTIESSNQVTIDNYANVPLDTITYVTSRGRRITSPEELLIDGEAAPPDTERIVDTLASDGSPDIGIDVRARRTFLIEPPVVAKNFSFSSLVFRNSVVSPERGELLRYDFSLTPEPALADSIREISVTAEIYGVRGERVRVLYREDRRSVVEPADPDMDLWDGRDASGRLVPGGIYILRFVVEPGVFRTTKAFSVVR